MKHNIYLIDLTTGSDRCLLPLGCGLIASYSRGIENIDKHYHIYVRMLDKGYDELINDVHSPVIVGIACYCWNFYGAIELTRRLKEKFPDLVVVWGGPQIPNRLHRVKPFMDEYDDVDILCHLEGEITFADLLQKGVANINLSKCNGITYRCQDSSFLDMSPPSVLDGITCHYNKRSVEYITTPKRDRVLDLDVLSSPFLDGTFDEMLEKYDNQIFGAIWETDRGCPFKCSFCDWGSALVSKVTRFDISRVVKELEWISQRKLTYIFATDANFGIVFGRCLEIVKKLVLLKQDTGYPDTLVVNWTKNSSESIVRLADILSKGGVTTNITLSYQSFHEPTLQAVQRDNIKPDYLNELKKEFHDKNCATYNEIILGLPEETLESFIDGINKGITYKLKDQMVIYLCLLLPNTQLAEDIEKYQLETRKCACSLNRRKLRFNHFGVDEFVVGTSSMPIEHWKIAYELSYVFMCLYNLRVASFLAVYFNVVNGIKVMDSIANIISIIDEDPCDFPLFARAIEHVRKCRQSVLDSESNVHSIEGSEGVVFSPHEAIAFFLLSNDASYNELKNIINLMRVRLNIDIDDIVFEELFDYQVNRIPTFSFKKKTQTYTTNIPLVMGELVNKNELIPTRYETVTVCFSPPKHNYDSAVEFNRRRVANGYKVSLNEAMII